MWWRRAVGLAIGGVALVGCNGGDATPSVATTGAGGLTDEEIDADNYRIGYTVCSTFTRGKLASDLGISSTEDVDLAEAFAEQYGEHRRRAPYEGCLDALTGEPQEWQG